jgi:hypothetical protein
MKKENTHKKRMEIADDISTDSHVPFEERESRTKITLIKTGLLVWYLGNVGIDIYLLIHNPHNNIIILRLVADSLGVLLLVAPLWWLVGTRTAIVGFVLVATQLQLPDQLFLIAISAFDFAFVTCAQIALTSFSYILKSCCSCF